MPDTHAVDNDFLEPLLGVIDWVHRTGWPSRTQDTALASAVFGAHWATADSLPGKAPDHASVVIALAAVLGADHDDVALRHLCVLFTVVFLVHTRSRGRGSPAR